jgi:hypothetical protein
VRETIVLKTAWMAGEWRYSGTVRVPKSLQVIAGVPIRTTGIRLTIGGKSSGTEYVTTTSCPRGGWRYQATFHLLHDATGRTSQSTVAGTSPCTS